MIIISRIKEWLKNKDNRTIIFTAISATFLLFSIFTEIKPFGIDMAWGAIILSGLPIVYGSFKRLILDKDIKAGLLVSCALIACVVVGEYFAAGEVVVIMMIGEILEDYTVRKSRMGLKKLIDLKPTTARVLRNGTFTVINSTDAEVGETVRIIAGETIPVDGLIIKGQTSIEQSAMTGESIPVDKVVGDEVYCATTNIHGTIDVRVTKANENSSISKMISMIEDAERKKAPILSVMDKWASYLVVTALMLSIIIGFATGDIIRGITVLVVFCPCALVLATPTAIAAGIGNATRHGVIIKSGKALERLAKVTMIAFDKTGTLTIGRPKVKAFFNFSKMINDNDMLKLVATAEKNSEHPYGKAIIEYATENNIPVREPECFTVVPGKGVIAIVDNINVVIGNKALMTENNIVLDDTTLEVTNKQLTSGNTSIYIGVNGEIVGCIGLADILREDSASIIAKVHEFKKRIVLLTGDNPVVAQKIAQQINIDDVKANLFPEDKVFVIDRFEKQDQKICMVGDGINDAPALKTAYVGVAMAGIGSDIASETADIVLVKDDISKLPYIIELSNRVLIKIKQNIIISLILNFGAIALAGFGLLNPVAGALVHNVGSVLVVINAAFLLRNRY